MPACQRHEAHRQELAGGERPVRVLLDQDQVLGQEGPPTGMISRPPGLIWAVKGGGM